MVCPPVFKIKSEKRLKKVVDTSIATIYTQYQGLGIKPNYKSEETIMTIQTYKITETTVHAHSKKADTVTTKTVQAKSAASALWNAGHISSRYVVNNNVEKDNAYSTWSQGTKTAYAEAV